MEVNKKYLEEFELLEEKYPEIMKRILDRGNWLSIMFSKIYEFLKKLSLEQEFKNTLNKDELFVFNSILQARDGDIKLV